MRTQDLLSQQLSYIRCSSVTYTYHVVNYFTSNYLSYNWKFVSFDNLPRSFPHPSPLVTTNLISFSSFLLLLFVCLFLKYNWPTTRCYSLIYDIVVQYFYTFKNNHHDKSKCHLSPYRFNYWPSSLHCTFHTCDSFILQWEVCTS